MTIHTAEMIVKAAENNGINVTFREDYSGRHMFSARTYAVICKDWQSFAAAAVIATAGLKDSAAEQLANEILELRMDSLGHDTIIY